MKKPWFVAHRGGAALETENTVKAFDRALKEPIDGLECDLQLTKDGVPILFHDRSLYKYKKRKSVKQFTWKELKSLPNQKIKEQTFSGQSLISYQEFLKRYSGKTKLFIEIKSRVSDRVDGTSKRLLDKILEVHKSTKPSKSKTYFMSFDSGLMQLVHQALPRYQHIQLSLKMDELDLNKISDFYGVGVPLQEVNKERVSELQRKGFRVLIYTCNGPRQLRAMKNAGVDVIVSDRPDWVRGMWEAMS